MSQMSDYLENKLIDHLFRSSSFAQPVGIYLALGTAAADGSFTEIASTGGYARKILGRSDTDWAQTQQSGGAAQSGVSTGTDGNTYTRYIQFGEASAAWNGGTDITHFGLFDTASGGNLLLWGALTTAGRVYAGDRFDIVNDTGLVITLG